MFKVLERVTMSTTSLAKNRFSHNISLFWNSFDTYPHPNPDIQEIQNFLFHWVDHERPPPHVSKKVVKIISLLMEIEYESSSRLRENITSYLD